MTLRSAPAPTARPAPAGRPAASRRTAAVPPPVETALDEALDHIGQLAERLWAVRRLHVPGRRSRFTPAARVRCAGCGQEMPCPTLQAAAA